MCLEEWSVLLLAVTAMVAVRNKALLCMLALVTEASLPVTGENTRESADMDVRDRMSGCFAHRGALVLPSLKMFGKWS